MRFGSVCSGIEAASVAWAPLGWEAAWLAEIEPFPAAVLAHHYPTVPNYGDMTALPSRIAAGEVEAPEVFCGGTPCQAFSVAGLRKSLDDVRGNLSLIFCEIANAIDTARAVFGHAPAIIFWENVPGVLSTKDNAFGCFLAGLAGEDDPLLPPGGRWTNAGCVFGPQRTVAWRVLDAQYFGVAQRRRRVFVVASARKGFDPAKVLFEFDGVRRDTAPRREAGQEITPTIRAGAPNGGAGHGARSGDSRDELIVPMTSACLTTGSGQRYDAETETLIPGTAHTLRGEGFDASEDGTGRGTPLVPVGITPHGTDPTVQKVASSADLAQCLRARTPGHIDNSSTTVVQQPVAYATKLHNTSSNQAGKFYENYTASLDANSPPPAIVFDTTQITSTADLAPSRCSVNPTAVAFQSSQSGVRIGETHATLDANNGPRRHNGALVGAQVRRLTPEECEALQGFPKNYTAIPWRKKPADQCPDGPRYKALGNSWAVPVVSWIGKRIQRHLAGAL